MVGRRSWAVGCTWRRLALVGAAAWSVACGEKHPPFADFAPPCASLNPADCASSKGGEAGEPGLVLTNECELPPEAMALGAQNWEPAGEAEEPETCAEAVASKSYIGCEFWPTVTANIVGYVFDFTVVVANTGTTEANIEVTRGTEVIATAVVAPDSLEKIYLPWVDELKRNLEPCEEGIAPAASVKVFNGAYRLTSDRPIVAYQFNPLQFEPRGGPPGKDWQECTEYSFTNDASLLLPTQALGTSYRGMTWTRRGSDGFAQPFMAITAVDDDTKLSVFAPAEASIAAGPGVPPIPEGTKRDFTLDRGEVLQLMARDEDTLSGSVLQSDRPVQVIAGDSCAYVPQGVAACDHLEETVPPAQALGQRYLVAPPTGPSGAPIPYTVELLGNRDGTQLYYPGGKPRGFPDTLEAGQISLISNVKESFEVLGSHEFGVLLFLQGGSDDQQGETDPSQSIAVPPQQFRKRYVFLAPDDYTVSYADVIAPSDADVLLDGEPVSEEPEYFECSPYKVLRVWLDQSRGGIHLLEGTKPIGVQVLGHASYTSYQYPGGLNVSEIAEPPVEPPVK
jgi:hypothetical protein